LYCNYTRANCYKWVDTMNVNGGELAAL